MPDDQSPLDWAFGPEWPRPFFDTDVDDLSHGAALLFRIHPAEGPSVLIDGVIDSPDANDQSDPYGLEIRADEAAIRPAVVLTSRAEACAFIDVLRCAVEAVWPDA